jgi:hypothetical protein
MPDLEQFKRHYLKVSGKTHLSATEEFYVKQLFDFLKEKDIKTQVDVNSQLGKIRCPTCDSEFAVPTESSRFETLEETEKRFSSSFPQVPEVPTS